MSKTHTLIFALHLSTPINQMNVFQIGKNNKRIRLDDIHKKISRNIPNRINLLKNFLESMEEKGLSKNKLKIALAIPSYILEVLIKEHNSAYNELKNIIDAYPVEFLLTTYYSSSLAVLSQEELSIQLFAEKKLIKKYFGLEPNIFFTNDRAVSEKTFSALSKQKIKGIVFATNGPAKIMHYLNSSIPVIDSVDEKREKKKDSKDVLIVNTYSFMDLSKNSVIDDIKSLLLKINSSDEKLLLPKESFNKLTSIVVLEKKQFVEQLSPMELKLLTELQKIYHPIKKTRDTNLIDEWRFLANKELIQNANPNTASQEHSPYEYFVNFMNILNDVAHTVRSVRAIEEGFDLPKVELSNNPSSLIKKIN